ncbi:FUSC family protein [Nocardioides sp. GXQ0305]|uniref:FUSC family protein n=1 Tax=Nocardioides sp. GXQ0305 TaxID=3423912 RepID=UPI003D7D938F
MRWLDWARRHDRNLSALRRAGRAAVVMPVAFYLGFHVLGNEWVGLFAVFGSFAMLVLSDFTGPMSQRLPAQVALGVAGLVLVGLGTLTSAHPWLAAVGMLCVGLPILFAGVVSSVLAGAAPALLLAYILPACLPGPASAIPERLAGWGLAALMCLVAVAVLWPTPTSDPLRAPVAHSMRLLADRIRSEVGFAAGGREAPTLEERERTIADSEAAVAELRTTFLAAPYRPTGLSAVDRTVVRLVDEVEWLAQVVRHGRPTNPVAHPVAPQVTAVKLAAADVLDLASRVLLDPGGGSRELESRVDVLHGAIGELDQQLRILPPGSLDTGPTSAERTYTALEPTFRSQELAFGTARLAGNVALTSAAWRRPWSDRVLGRQPAGLPTRWAAAAERGSAHLRLSSVWLQNSVRGATGLALAVFVANTSGIQHAFWVVLGTLSVLRSNALSTGQNAVRGLVGTAAGFVVGGVLVDLIGTNEVVLWSLFPIAILVAGFLPAAVSFTAGQAAFTVLVMILFNLIQPAGWEVGLVRIEDVALGCAVSLLVGLLFWPRGAGAELGRAIATAYGDSIRLLDSSVAFGMACSEQGTARAGEAASPDADARVAAASSRRLDDAYRTYLAERGAKPSSLASVTRLVNGVVGLRLAADAVVDLWLHGETVPADRAAARRVVEDASQRLVQWFDAFARSLVSDQAPPEALDSDADPAELAESLRPDLSSDNVGRVATAARFIWTHDYLDAIRRYQGPLVEPSREVRRLTLARGRGPVRLREPRHR